MSEHIENSNGKRFSSKGRKFYCPWCDKKKVGTYSFVDGHKSCVDCDRKYSPIITKIKCPVCNGTGHFYSEDTV